MSEHSNIEWTDTTWNPVVGCTPMSPGCLNCYAARMARRLDAMGQDAYRGLANNMNGRPVFNGTVRTLPNKLTDPIHWKKPRRVFVNSMSDLFHEAVPFDFIDKAFAVMALCPQHTFQVLTKRPDRMAEYLADPLKVIPRVQRVYDARITHVISAKFPQSTKSALPPERHESSEKKQRREGHVDGLGGGFAYAKLGPQWPLPNVWLGTSVENQKAADDRIPHLLRCPAAVRFLSCEPLLGPIDLFNDERDWIGPIGRHGAQPVCRGIDWVIVGGESGPSARPCEVGWIRSIRDQLKAARLPVFVKQLGSLAVFEPWHSNAGPTVNKWFEPTVGDDFDTHRITDSHGGDWSEWPEDLRVRDFPKIGGAA